MITGRGGGFPVGLQPNPASTQQRGNGVPQADAGVSMAPLPLKAVGEPFLSLPTPPGWTMMCDHDSPLVRGVLVNVGLRALEFTPIAVITLADVSEDARNAQEAIANEEVGVQAQPEVSGVASHDGTLCGYASRTLMYRYEGRDTTTLIVSGTDWFDRTWVCTVGIQTAVPDDARFARDRAIIVGNFQFLLLRGGG